MNSSVIVMIMVATQIIAESFPISSSGHMLLVEKLAIALGLGCVPVLPEFFDHFLHGPTIIVVIVYFWRAWAEPFRLLFTGLLDVITNKTKKMRGSWRQLCMIFFKIVGFVSITDGITVILYYVIKKRLHDTLLLDNNTLLLAGFIVTTGLLLSLRFLKYFRCYSAGHGASKTLSSFCAVILGIVQGLTTLPGISRFASTYVIVRWLGISHRRAFQFSFLALFPLIIAGFFVNGLPQVYEFFTSESLREISNPSIRLIITWGILFIGSTIVSFYALKLADYRGAREKLWWFGMYMLVPVTVTFLLLFVGF